MVARSYVRALIPIACFLPSFAPIFAQASAARMEFEVASVKRNLSGSRPWLAPPVGGRFTATNVPLKLLIGLGWTQRISGGPAWVFADPCFYGTKIPHSEAQIGCAEMSVTPESIANEKVSMEWFAGVLGGLLGRPVLNRTGFTGSFKVRLEFARVALNRESDSTKPSIFAALEQLGLKLESQKGTEEVLIIEHVEKPSGN
jgi:hypothetical protein